MFINGFEPTVAGDTAVTLAQFVLEKNTPTANSYVTYQVVDEDGTVYSQGQGSSLNTVVKPNAKVIESEISIPVPSDIPVNELGTTYQVQLVLQLTAQDKTTLYSNLNVLPMSINYLGSEDIIEFEGNKVHCDLVVDGIPSAVNPLVYGENDLLPIPTITPAGPTTTSDGYVYSLELDTAQFQMPASLTPYNILWQYILNGENQTESSALYLINPTISMAVKDLMAVINKAKSSIRDKQTFDTVDALVHLRMGADMFNGAAGVATNFSMLRARGAIRQYWLMYSQISALRAQYLEEGIKNFDFQGQSVQLTTQQEQYYEQMASAIENSLTEPVRTFKSAAAKRGHITGDGSSDPTRLKKGAIGTVGITLSATSRIRPWNPNTWLGSQRSIF